MHNNSAPFGPPAYPPTGGPHGTSAPFPGAPGAPQPHFQPNPETGPRGPHPPNNYPPRGYGGPPGYGQPNQPYNNNQPTWQNGQLGTNTYSYTNTPGFSPVQPPNAHNLPGPHLQSPWQQPNNNPPNGARAMVCLQCGGQTGNLAIQPGIYCGPCGQQRNSLPAPINPVLANLCIKCKKATKQQGFEFCSKFCADLFNHEQNPGQFQHPVPPTPPAPPKCESCKIRNAIANFKVCSVQCRDWNPATGCLCCLGLLPLGNARLCSEVCRQAWCGTTSAKSQPGSPVHALSPASTAQQNQNSTDIQQPLPSGTPQPPPPAAPTTFTDFSKLVEAGDVQTMKVNETALKANIRNSNDLGEMLIHIAVKKGQLEVVKLLHQCGADLKAPTSVHGSTPLHLAMRPNAPANDLPTVVQIAEYLVKHGAPKNVLDQYGYYPYDRASQNAALRKITGPERPALPLLSTDTIDDRVLFPTVGMNQAQARVTVDRNSAEWKQIVYFMNGSIKPIHDSYLRKPYGCYFVKTITRLYNAQRWADCEAQTKSQNGRPYWYLWHGTSLKASISIEEAHFRPSPHGTHGPAIYMAKNSSLAHLHAKKHRNSDCEANNNHHYMFLCAVNVGKWAQSVDAPDYSNARTAISDMRQKTGADTIVQAMPKNNSEYMEIMLWEPKRVYPCYRVEYQPIGKDGKEIPNPDTA